MTVTSAESHGPVASIGDRPAWSVQLNDVVKSFGSTTAVDRLTLDVKPGEMLSFLGPSGCGKTTLLRLIAGFEQADSGEVRIAGSKVDGQPAWNRNIGMVFQRHALFPHMSVGKNVAFGLRMRHIEKDQVAQRVRDSLSLVSLEHMADRMPDQLSGGQQQRVAIARALIIEPGLLLLDEPLSALDAKLRSELREEIRTLQLRLGITAIFVTHDQAEALSISDRVALMSEGRLQQLGTPEEIYDRPATALAAGFIGSANLIRGESVGADDGVVTIRTGSGELVTAESNGLGGSSSTACIKHERVAIRRRDHKTSEAHVNSIAGTVEGVTFTGAGITYKCSTPDGPLTAWSVHDGTHERLSVGNAVWLEWGPRDAHLVVEKARD